MLRKKENKLIIGLLCALIILLFGGLVVQSAENIDQIIFRVHKKVIKKNKNEVINSKATSFSVYDATEFVTLGLKDMTIEQIQNEVLNTDSNKLREKLTNKKKLTTIETSAYKEDEVAQFSYKVSGSNNQAFLFLEDELTQNLKKEKAVPILIMLPVENPQKSGEFLDEIDIYPKSSSYQDTPNVPEPPKKVPPKRFLPQTGEVKTLMVLIGLMLVGVTSFIWQKREKIWRMSHEKNA